MESLNWDHQREIFDPADATSVNVIGAGSVGSQVVDTLAREGCSNITAWDHDVLNSSNIPMSIYRVGDILRYKVDALAEIVKINTGIEITKRVEKYIDSPLRTPVICCVDTIDQRRIIWRQVKRNQQIGLFVDTRIAEEYFEVFAINPCDPHDIEYYGHFVEYSSAQAHKQTCGLHGIKHVSSTAANAACAALTTWWKGGIPIRHVKMLGGIFQQV